jgi:DNA polymerase V
VRGESMFNLGIETGDLLVVDRLKNPENGSVVLARLGTTYTIKKFSEIVTFNKRRKFYLVPSNPKFEKRRIFQIDDFEIVGVVTHSVKKFGV